MGFRTLGTIKMRKGFMKKQIVKTCIHIQI